MSEPATVGFEAAAETLWDVVVIGAGPAGAMAARELARRGVRVLLTERKAVPRAKVCGACLNQRAISCLQLAGLGDLLPGLRAIPITRFRAWAGGRNVEIELPGGAAVSREAFDGALVQAAIEAGAAFLPGATATLGDAPSEADERHIELAAPAKPARTVRVKVVLAAAGLGNSALGKSSEFVSRVSPRTKLGVRARIVDSPLEFRPGTVSMAIGCGGYAGLVRVEDGSLNLAAALAPEALKRAGSPEAAVAAILAEAGLPALPLPAGAAWRGTAPLTRQLVRPAGRRVLVLGDAAGYVEPFTGEGIAWALASGLAAAPLAEQGLRAWDRRLEQAWLHAHRRLVRDRQFWCRGFAALLRRPRLARLAVEFASAWPAVCRPIVSSLNRPLRPLEICRS